MGGWGATLPGRWTVSAVREAILRWFRIMSPSKAADQLDITPASAWVPRSRLNASATPAAQGRGGWSPKAEGGGPGRGNGGGGSGGTP